MKPRILIAGIGNIFLGDDAFGVEVAQRMLRMEWPEHVRVVDYGIRGFDLAYALMDDYDAAILVDATPRGGTPGTLYTMEIDPAEFDVREQPEMFVETHGMNPMKVLALVKALGGEPRGVLVLGCEPGSYEEGMGLSEPVRIAVDEAVRTAGSLIAQIERSYKQTGDYNEHGKCFEGATAYGGHGVSCGDAAGH